MPTTFFLPWVKFRNAVPFFGNTVPECTRRSPAAVDVGECPGNEEEQRAGRAGRMRAVPKRQGAHWDFPIVSPQADRGAAPFTSSLERSGVVYQG